MNKKQKLTAFALIMSLMSANTAFARGNAPTSQFGFKGWPYRKNNSCVTQNSGRPTPTAIPSATCTPAPASTPTAAPAPEATSAPTLKPTNSPTPEPTMQPTAVPTVKPITKPTAKPAPTAAPVPTTPPSNGDDYTTPSITAQEENAFILLNQDRIANGLSPLTLDPALCSIARAKSRDMNDKKYFSHTSPTYGSASQMLKHFGYVFTSVGENIAHHATIEKAQAAFMSSNGHRRNILGSQWSKVGIGVWKDSQGFVYVTQLFVR